jgi:mannitol-specific phosphotransferase system IIBC component
MKRSIGFLVLLQAIFATAASAAGTVTVTYTGVVSSTPAPSTWMLMGVGLVLAFFVFRKAHSLPGGRAAAAILMLAGISSYEIFTGSPLVPKASALVAVVLQSITGGTSIQFVNLADDGNTEGQVTNNTASTLTITSVVLSNAGQYDGLGTASSSPTCVQGTILAPGGSCYVEIYLD